MVGHATRMLVSLEEKRSAYIPRFRHTFAGCYILDNLLSLQLQRRPYLQNFDVERVGKVYEDGLEEWQPWVGCLDTSAAGSSTRTPILGLSTFNCLVEVIGILNLTSVVHNSSNVLQEVIGRVELWKASLPTTFKHVRSERVPIPPAPPALLLQAVYHCCSLIIYSSQLWAQRTLEVLEQFRDVVGLIAMPPVINTLLDTVERNRAFSALDDRSRLRFSDLRSQLKAVWRNSRWVAAARIQNESPAIRSQGSVQERRSAHSRRSFGSSMPTPDSIQIPFNTPAGRASNTRSVNLVCTALLRN